MKCRPHTIGIDISKPPTFDPGCVMCWYLQESGGRSGLEPRPGLTKRRRLTGARFDALLARQAACRRALSADAIERPKGKAA